MTFHGLPWPSMAFPYLEIVISRQELDARVQQILGRHGQALAELGSATTPR